MRKNLPVKMCDWPENPLLINRAGAVELTYAQLGERLKSPTFRPQLRPENTAEALIALLTAYIRQTPLRLIDGDLSPQELSNLGIKESDLELRTSLSSRPPESFAQALRYAQSGSGFLLSLYTSGSTGLPKLVTHNRESLTRTLRSSDRHALNTWALAYNPTHIAGVQVALQAFHNRNTIVDVFGLDRTAALRLFAQWSVTHVSATPTFYRMLLPVDHPAPALESITLGGERSSPELLAKLAVAFPKARIRNLYASTEAGTLLVSDGDVFGVHSSLKGKVRIKDGQILVARELLAHFGSDEKCDDWYATGDRVEVLSESPLRFRILGRQGDFINVGGAKVDPAEVEDALRCFPGVMEARVYGRPNSVVGTLLCAEYTAGTPISEQAYRAFLADRLQPHKVPRIIKSVDFLPKTRTGKLIRRA